MIIIYCDHITNRTRYTVKTIFNDILNINEVLLTNNIDEFERSNFVKINYSRKNINKAFKIIPNGLLSENVINNKLNLEFLTIRNEIKAPFVTNDNDIEFDIFSAVFYIISRYEEYTNDLKDKHNRYPAQESVLFKYSLLNIPVINIWVEYLLSKLNSFYDIKIVNQSNFKALFTLDIDIAYAFKHKTPIRNISSMAKKVFGFKFHSLKEQLSVLNNNKPDPFDTYDYFLHKLNTNNVATIIFILLGNFSAHNINLSYKNKAFRNLIKKLASKHKLGIHPSYNTSDNFELLKEEINRLRNIISEEIYVSRQHYLKFNIPKTYQNIIHAGIKEDYSMAYAGFPGFRSGTCSAFNWYDLENNKETVLRIYPTSLMDGTLNEYMHLSIEDAISTIKKYKGCFIPLWHNNTLSEQGIWYGWRKVFEAQIEECLKN